MGNTAGGAASRSTMSHDFAPPQECAHDDALAAAAPIGMHAEHGVRRVMPPR